MDSKNLVGAKYIGMVSIIVLGLIFHELYKSTGITLLGIISPVNESKWEHWKMAYWPMVIVSLFEYRFAKDHISNYIFALAVGVLVFELVTFGSIELYDILIAESTLPVHVATFLLGGVLGQMARYAVMTSTSDSKSLLIVGMAVLIVHMAVFAAFTFNPPRADYFRDSIKHTYGIYDET